ncbi:TOM1-like protein 1 [Arachis stenosperma]|uniref:TOM1-like protein 1 n=1 Tax=Arachis stenosperma TaxID=217475 RepID=UPI0025ACC3B0|nr:TOM1-like protein 1 [Arachis stenosperma]
MADNLMDKVNALGERLKMSEVGRKMSEGMSSMSFKVKEFFNGPNQVDKLVEDATSESLDEPDWAMNLDLCDLINTDKVNSIDLIRGIKKRIQLKSPRVQYLSLVLLETIVKNCEKAFSEVAAERVLDDMVRLIDDPQTVVNNRNKALIMIEAWGESTSELRYLPVYEETYKSLKSRGIRFPGRDNESLAPIFTPPRSVSEAELDLPRRTQHEDIPVQSFTPEQTKEAFDVARNSIELLSTVLSSSPQQDVLQDELTTTLVQQCRRSQTTVQQIVETAGDDEALLFEALNVNDEIQKVLSKYEDLRKPTVIPVPPEPAMIPVAVEPEESPRHAKEDALIRKPAGSRAAGHGGSNEDMMDDLDEMIFGKKGGDSSGGGHDTKKQQSSKDDLISF